MLSKPGYDEDEWMEEEMLEYMAEQMAKDSP